MTPRSTQTGQQRVLDAPPGSRRRRIACAIAALATAALIAPAAAAGSITCPDSPGSGPCLETGHPEGSDFGLPGETTVPIGACPWVVKGQLMVRNPTVDGLADRDPIERVKVKVSGRAQFGVYKEWDTVDTDANGEFTVEEQECSKRKVKVEAMFESESKDLRVTSSKSKKWYKLYESGGTITRRTIDIDDEPFGPGFEPGDQGTTQARTDAQTWIVYRKALDYAAAIGQPFLNDTTVKNPATISFGGQSWTDPILHAIHIAPASTARLDTLLHEAGHAWAYPREVGEGCLTTEVSPVLGDGSTHDDEEDPCVALNEGFADFFGLKIEQEMDAAQIVDTSTGEMTASNRARVTRELGLADLDMIARNEWGWDQVFRVLTSADITRDLFGLAPGSAGFVSTYSGPACAGQPGDIGDLAHALEAFGDAQDQLDVQNPQDPSVVDFFGRVADRLVGFDDSDAVAYTDAVDPTSVTEPHTFYGC